jgi:AAA15 family ATPase/GTPase
MLRKFSVSGYKNFKDETTLDLTIVKNYEFNKECIIGDLLGKALIMGPNGSGKSNLGYALFDIVYTLTDKQTCIWQKDVQSFINGEGYAKFATFKYEFQHDGSIISYEYRKTQPNVLTYEKMSIDGQVIFEFDHMRNIALSNNLRAVNSEKLRLDGQRGSLSIIRFIANNTSQSEGSPIVFLMNFVSNMLYFKSTQDGNMFIGLERAGDDVESYLIRNGLVEGLEKFLKENTELNIKLSTANAPGMPKIMVQKLNTKSVLFSSVASSGTKALELFYYWSKRFDKVSLLFIDEFDAFYHFELAEKIVRLLMTYSNTQIILTSHNTSIVSNRVMRPDCYLQIRDGEIKSLSDSTGRELRKGHNLEKMLRNGEFNE